MTLWRISRHRDLSGTGGLRAPGRWHHAGHPVVYLAESPASALLEACVHTSAEDVPPEFTLLKIEGPELEFSVITSDLLSEDWRSHFEVTRDLGTAWLKRNEAVLLQVPSALVPETANFLFNSIHRDARKFAVVEASLYPFDVRLKK